MPSSLYEPIQYLLDMEGKKIRPALVLMAYHLFKEDYERALPAAQAIEVFHNFSLMHDDIMDNASLRRGNKTVHESFDQNSAILSGDVMLIHAYKILSTYDNQHAIELIRIFNQMAIELCEGQRMDMDFEVIENVSIEDYLKMIEYKTSVLLGAALEMGASLTNSSNENRQHLAEFGKKLGIAFQIQDDILDTFGDATAVGKKSGGDIVQNKKTYLYLKACELGDAKQRETLAYYYSSTIMNEDEKIEAVKKIFMATGALEYANQLREAYHNLALAHVEQLDVDLEKKSLLKAFADYLNNRVV